MLIVIPGATTNIVTGTYIVQEIRESKEYTRKYLSNNNKVGNNGGIKEQKDMTPRKQIAKQQK